MQHKWISTIQTGSENTLPRNLVVMLDVDDSKSMDAKLTTY